MCWEKEIFSGSLPSWQWLLPRLRARFFGVKNPARLLLLSSGSPEVGEVNSGLSDPRAVRTKAFLLSSISRLKLALQMRPGKLRNTWESIRTRSSHAWGAKQREGRQKSPPRAVVVLWGTAGGKVEAFTASIGRSGSSCEVRWAWKFSIKALKAPLWRLFVPSSAGSLCISKADARFPNNPGFGAFHLLRKNTPNTRLWRHIPRGCCALPSVPPGLRGFGFAALRQRALTPLI